MEYVLWKSCNPEIIGKCSSPEVWDSCCVPSWDLSMSSWSFFSAAQSSCRSLAFVFSCPQHSSLLAVWRGCSVRGSVWVGGGSEQCCRSRVAKEAHSQYSYRLRVACGHLICTFDSWWQWQTPTSKEERFIVTFCSGLPPWGLWAARVQ